MVKKTKSTISGVGAIFYRQFYGNKDKTFQCHILIPDTFSVYEYILEMMKYYKQPRKKDSNKLDLLRGKLKREEQKDHEAYGKFVKGNKDFRKIEKFKKDSSREAKFPSDEEKS